MRCRIWLAPLMYTVSRTSIIWTMWADLTTGSSQVSVEEMFDVILDDTDSDTVILILIVSLLLLYRLGLLVVERVAVKTSDAKQHLYTQWTKFNRCFLQFHIKNQFGWNRRSCACCVSSHCNSWVVSFWLCSAASSVLTLLSDFGPEESGAFDTRCTSGSASSLL